MKLRWKIALIAAFMLMLAITIGECCLRPKKVKIVTIENTDKLDSLTFLYGRLMESYKRDSLSLLKLDSLLKVKEEIIKTKMALVDRLEASRNKQQNEKQKQDLIRLIDIDSNFLDSLRKKHFN